MDNMYPYIFIILDVNSCLTMMSIPTWELFHYVLEGKDDLIVSLVVAAILVLIFGG